jgi:hypothetical protein
MKVLLEFAEGVENRILTLDIRELGDTLAALAAARGRRTVTGALL